MEGDSTKILAGVAVIKEKRAEWNALVETKKKIESDCSHFGIKEPEFPVYEEVESDLEKHEQGRKEGRKRGKCRRRNGVLYLKTIPYLFLMPPFPLL